MLEPDPWDAVLSRITGTVYRGTERISSNARFATFCRVTGSGPTCNAFSSALELMRSVPR